MVSGSPSWSLLAVVLKCTSAIVVDGHERCHVTTAPPATVQVCVSAVNWRVDPLSHCSLLLAARYWSGVVVARATAWGRAGLVVEQTL